MNVLLTNPLWVVNSKLKMYGVNKDKDKPKFRGIIDGLFKIAMEEGRNQLDIFPLKSYIFWQEGVMSLWNGTKASLMLVSNPAIKFTVYELLKRHYTRASGRTVSGLGAFILGCIATATATLATYPMQVLQVKGEIITMDIYTNIHICRQRPD